MQVIITSRSLAQLEKKKKKAWLFIGPAPWSAANPEVSGSAHAPTPSPHPHPHPHPHGAEVLWWRGNLASDPRPLTSSEETLTHTLDSFGALHPVPPHKPEFPV